ncbi:MAG: ribonuclease J [Christensenellaceae bacterium]|nr:ribonuclease J [Christensenellaceae bacterium]
MATRSKSKKTDNEKRLRIIPLGGLGEVGKNMTVFEYGDDIIAVDMGSIFPREDMPGVDLVIPDTTYLTKNASRIRAYVITHGHEDHIGASPYILRNLPAPVYGTRLTLALVEHKLKEHRVNGIQLNVIQPGDSVKISDSFEVEFLKANHSIAGAVMLAIKTPVGTVIHTGDFKVDYTPIDGQVTDLGRLAELGREGVLLLLADSTNVERPGYTMSERTVGETFMNLFGKAPGRIIVAMFASNVHRIQQVVDAAVRYNRKFCLVGRSMLNVSKVAMQLGELKIPEGRLISVDDLDRYDDDEIVVMTTGSQGEPMSGLARMAFAEHRKLEVRKSDMVIVSATPIPGNERSVSRVINQLVRSGANVIYEAIEDVHVSGHACREELKLIHTLAHPKFFIPVHGEYRHLHQHADLAMSLGLPAEQVQIIQTGDIMEVGTKKLGVVGTVPSGEVLIDGLGIGDVGAVVLRDRKHLSQDGLLMVIMAVDRNSGMVVSGPDIISRGFVYMREADALVEGTRSAAKGVLESFGRIDPSDWNHVKGDVREAVQKYIYDNIKRSPMILPVIVEI